MAKTYLEVNPRANVILLDDKSTIGGVWAKERVYRNLRTNNIFPTFGYSDFPLQTTYGVKPGEHIPGEIIHQYLHDFAEHFDILRRIEFGSRVQSVEQRPDDTWLLTISRSAESAERPPMILANRLVIATGTASNTYLPHFKGASSFGKSIFHSAHFARYEGKIPLDSLKKVVVLGGAKSAWDVVHSYASSGVKVEWVIRADGNGPAWMAPTRVTPIKLLLEKLVFVRFLMWLSPCIWGDADGHGRIRNWFHSTWIGRRIVSAFWWILTQDLLMLNRYEKHPETKKLLPWVAPFWHGCSLSILNHPTNIWELFRSGMIKVHIANIEYLSSESVKLSTGETLKDVDQLCCATGWRHQSSFKFLPEDAHLERSLGFPHHSSAPDPAIEAADAVILEKFPQLRSQPKLVREVTTLYIDEKTAEEKAINQPYRLFRFMVPPANYHKRNFAVVGSLLSFGTAIVSNAQALWVTAYFAGKLSPSDPLIPRPSTDIVSMDDIEWQTVLENRFGRWRYPCGFGARYPDFVFDVVPYVDLLLRDLGVRRWRKKSRLAEFFKPYGPEDYQGLVKEWRETSGIEKDRKMSTKDNI